MGGNGQDRVRDPRRYYRVAGITIGVDSDLPFGERPFQTKIEAFRAAGPGVDTVVIHHKFAFPDLSGDDPGTEVYRRPPWAVSRRGDQWVYRVIAADPADPSLYKIAIFDGRHERGTIFHPDAVGYTRGNLHSLTAFPTDQILLGRLLADREGCLIHACGAILDGHGLLFVGHSEAGKTTMVTMLRGRAEILCDDRIAVRRLEGVFRIYGTWSHGEAPDVSPASAPLRAVFFLRKAGENRITPMTERREVLGRLLSCLIRPLPTRDWWVSTLDVVERLSREARFYDLEFDRGGGIVTLLEELAGGRVSGRPVRP